MLVVSVPKQELNDAGKIANSVNLRDIKLRKARVDETGIESFFDLEDKTNANLNINYRSSQKELIEGQVLTALVGVDVTITKGESKVFFSLEYVVSYALPAGKIPENLTPVMFEAFAKHNGLLNCWPYVRTQMSNLGNEVGLPITLPLLKIQPKVEEQQPQKSV